MSMSHVRDSSQYVTIDMIVSVCVRAIHLQVTENVNSHIRC